ncbi:DUF192 domain-containing protein [Halobacterium litoreum]|uniref:DUF192 domain-containing protein n=1 Tax=Halobacterium litoreum TaxID=2039234 RepID=A0ABD5NG37_9EURY|nr:DUF192 domain-containing protein [Halobacterium litoreum]UHH12946.1 DUF192 domain-containing protein [Halobacterium litoreum]
MVRRALAVVCLLAVAGCVGGTPAADSTTTPAETVADTTRETAVTTESGPSVTVLARNGTELGAVDVMVADTPSERYTGLSDTESLGPNEGMLFVYADEGRHTYVMRSMSFPIDIVYVDADGRITEIHHAPVEDDNEDLTRYPGRGKWVLEVPYNWTVEHGVEVGDVVRVDT